MDSISVIIPVYNVEKYIHRCVDSVINQTYQNLEIILVDDGSPDNCGKICDEYAKLDSRIKVIHKANGGLSDARNAGLNIATGEWITFIDSDDWIHIQLIEKLYDAAIKKHVKVSICGYGETSGECPTVDVSAEPVLLTSKKMWLKKRINATIACAKLYHKSCFDTLRFPKGKIHEDEFTTYRILFEQERIAFIDQPYYAYFVNDEGITKSAWSPKRLVILDALEERLEFFAQMNDDELVDDCENLYIFIAYNNYAKAEAAGYKNSCKLIKRKMRKMAFKNAEKMFDREHIWIMEKMFPKFMKCYWIAKSVYTKIFKK